MSRTPHPQRGEAGSLLARAVAWRDADPDPVTRAELTTLLDRADTVEIARRFDGSLAFGTAGIRAPLGAGPLRLNRLVVGRVAAGLACYIEAHEPGAASTGVAVGYDARANSQVFATDAARILARAGVAVWLLPRAVPTPVLAFAVRHLHAAYGLMVTASHNPRGDNGLKLYVADGGQLLPPADTEIAASIEATDPLGLPSGWAAGPFPCLSADHVADSYVAAVAASSPPAHAPRRSRLTVVHTALHGVGAEPLRAVLSRAGWQVPIPVPAQERPDPAFPTTPYPNPEEPGVLDLAREAAERVHADLVLANDPDADRLAVMVRGPAGLHTMTGDELGALLGDAVLSRLADGRPLEDPGPLPAVVATTVVSGSLLRRLADAAGVRCVTTLTGFKWIARAAGPGARLVYGYEEALGYAIRPSLVADKDGISAALFVIELAEEAALAGRSLLDRLDDLAVAHGLYVTGQRSVRVSSAEGLSALARVLDRVRATAPPRLAGLPVTVTDLRSGDGGAVDLAGGHGERWPGEPLPPADVLIWHAGRDARVALRPSGTEPKLKLYVETVRRVRSRDELPAARAAAGAQLDRLADDALAWLGIPDAAPEDAASGPQAPGGEK